MSPRSSSVFAALARPLVALAGVVLVALMLFVGPAYGQGAPAPVDAQTTPAPDFTPPRAATTAGKTVSKRDSVQSPPAGAPTNVAGKRTRAGMAFAFWGFAALTVLGSLFVITRRNMVTAVMGMVGTFFALAALYMLLYAHFLAIIQMLVYAGAIMVLFVFVIMILNKPEAEPMPATGRAGKALAGLAMVYLVARIGSVLVDVPSRVTAVQNAAPAKTAFGDDWGSTAAVGWNLFNDYLFPFEAVSILLLIAVVGAIAIARPFKDDEPAADAPAAGAGGH
ncbi:MAG: NADH-quinone oxidoreductase subunit J [Myxococcales bacterium]|nr:NADH-quinone oxidoreductase subunit J [Myxococcales bacterium]